MEFTEVRRTFTRNRRKVACLYQGQEKGGLLIMGMGGRRTISNREEEKKE
jgi:hypothetical protein